MANFGQLMKQDPRLAYGYTNAGSASPWFQQNQMGIKDKFFGGDQNGMNQWINQWGGGNNNLSDDDRMMLGGMAGAPGATGGAPTAATGWLGSMGGGYQKGVSGGVDPNNPLGVTTNMGGAGGNMAQQQQTGGAEPNPYLQNSTGLPQSPTTMPGMGEAGGGQAQAPTDAIGGGSAYQPVQAQDLNVNSFLDPSMNFRIQQGTNALESSAAARGGLLSGATLKGVQDYSQNIASQEYGNAVNRAMQDRGYRSDMARDSRNFNWGVDRDNRDFGYRRDTGDRDFAWNAGRDDRDFNESQRRYDTGFDYNARRDDRDFNYRSDVGDRDFAWNAQRDDRNFNWQRDDALARLGLAGTQGGAGLQAELARILNQNIIGGGNAGGAGAVGGANATNDMITQILRLLSGRP